MKGRQRFGRGLACRQVALKVGHRQYRERPLAASHRRPVAVTISVLSAAAMLMRRGFISTFLPRPRVMVVNRGSPFFLTCGTVTFTPDVGKEPRSGNGPD